VYFTISGRDSDSDLSTCHFVDRDRNLWSADAVDSGSMIFTQFCAAQRIFIDAIAIG
jgi:hypothetical protein